MRPVIKWIDVMNLWVGRVTCLLLLPVMAAMVFEVVSREAFRIMATMGMDDVAREWGLGPTLWAYETTRMFAGAMFMLGAGYALMRGVHIRADFLYRNFSVSMQGRVDLTLYLLFYFPGLLVFLWTSIDFAWGSLSSAERGMDTAWMPYLGPIKAVLPVGIVLLLIQGISEVLKCWYAATRGRWPQ